ncbi:hypothetical protein EJ110_NYTH09766 [Nymphaea thermarum]|nr:hypothetical protein EJ110_NYTH09766 [Nymphaea thermarum]
MPLVAAASGGRKPPVFRDNSRNRQDRTAPPAPDPEPSTPFFSPPPSLPPNCLSPPTLVLDLIFFAFFLVLIVGAPLLNAQAALPSTLFPDPLLRIASWYKDRFGDYLASERPFFFVRLDWHELEHEDPALQRQNQWG